jgi:hypothetical protein
MQLVECDEGYELAVVVAGLEQFRFTRRMVEQLLAHPAALSLSLDPLIAVANQVLSQAKKGGNECGHVRLGYCDRPGAQHVSADNRPVAQHMRLPGVETEPRPELRVDQTSSRRQTSGGVQMCPPAFTG